MGKVNIQCTTCWHEEICKFCKEYKAAIRELETVSYSLDDGISTTIRDTKWLDIELKCQHYRS